MTVEVYRLLASAQIILDVRLWFACFWQCSGFALGGIGSGIDEHTLMHVLESTIEEGGEIRACVYSDILDSGSTDKYTRVLGGSTNTPARYTNGSPSVCDQAALAENNSHRYVHVEQSWDIRDSELMRGRMAVYIAEAIKDYFDGLTPAPFAQQGTIPIQRVAGDNIALCEALSKQ